MTTQSGRLESLALAGVLAIGAGIVWLLAVVTGLHVVQDAFFPYRLVGERLVILGNGTPVVETFQGENPHSYRSLDGKRLDSIDANDRLGGAFLRGPRSRGGDYSSWSRRITHIFQQSSGDLCDYVNWYFVHDGALHGHGYFVGYDPMTKLRVGCLGRNGCRPEEPIAEEQFPVDSHDMPLEAAQAICHLVYPVKQSGGRYIVSNRDLLYLVTRDGLVQIDLRARTVKAVRSDASLISVVASGSGHDTLLARTPNRILALEHDGKEIGAYPLPAELREEDLVWSQIGKDRILVQAGWDRNDLFWFDAAGKILRHERVDLHALSRQPIIVDQMATLLAMPLPALHVAFLVGNPWEGLRSQDRTIGYFVTLGRAANRAWPTLLFVSVVSILLAALCYRRQRKYGLPWTAVWTLFVLLFGLPAYFGYMAHRRWPARLPCPHCGRRVPRDRSMCCACGRDFPAPAVKGIEVFA